MSRHLRQPPTQAQFDGIVIPTPPTRDPLPAFRLGNPSHASQFFPNPASRLTPVSLKFPCVYLAANRETALAEKWGDRLWMHREAKLGVFVIDKSLAETEAFMEVAKFPPLTLCDLTHADVRAAVGLESGTLYAPDLLLPQTWAERIALHPIHFDGILYRSRITDEKCLVLWLRPGGRLLEPEMSFPIIGPFLDSDEAFKLAQKCGVRLSFGR